MRKVLDDKTTGALRRELGTDAFVQLAETFFIDFGTRLSRFAMAVESKDRAALEFEAYSVLGSAVNIGLIGLAHEAGTVSRLASDGDWEDIKAGLSRLRRAAGASVEALAEETGHPIDCPGCTSFSWEPGADNKTGCC